MTLFIVVMHVIGQNIDIDDVGYFSLATYFWIPNGNLSFWVPLWISHLSKVLFDVILTIVDWFIKMPSLLDDA